VQADLVDAPQVQFEPQVQVSGWTWGLDPQVQPDEVEVAHLHSWPQVQVDGWTFCVSIVVKDGNLVRVLV